METENQLRVLKCISDETRLKILDALKNDERCVREIIDEIKMEQSLVSHHLRGMRKCGLVLRRREGKKIMYRLADKSVINLLKDIRRMSEKFCVKD
ncbi:MAG: metalloregulator ArsR/SmtB family transcription factor [Methanobacteriota archaeon]